MNVISTMKENGKGSKNCSGSGDSQSQGHDDHDHDDDEDGVATSKTGGSGDNGEDKKDKGKDYVGEQPRFPLGTKKTCCGENSVVTGSLNPIFIPSIINHIASFLPCGDLKRCRHLNKQWNEECTKFLRQKGLVRLTTSQTIKNFLSEFQKRPKFCENVHFEILNGIDNVTKKFLTIFGPNIKYFKLDFSTNGYHLSANEFYDLIFKYLPNLQELSLVGRISEEDHFLPEKVRELKEEQQSNNNASNNNHEANIDSSPSRANNNNNGKNKNSTSPERNDVPPSPILMTTLPNLRNLEIFLYNTSGKNISKHQFLVELLSCVPNLKKISVPKVPLRMLAFGMPLLHTLITTDQLHFHELQHLDMDIALYNGSIDVLKSKGYPLRYLNAEINSTVSEDSLHSFLKTYGKTLLALQLKFPRSPVATSEFTCATSFHNLRHLTLHGYKGSLQFLGQLDKLQSFGLIDNSFSLALSRENLERPLEAQFNYQMIWTDWTEEAYSFDCFNSSNAQLLKIFSSNFQNLGSLNLPHLNDHDLRIIYNTFSHSLQELTMENSLFSDYGLTGISHGIFCDLEEMGKVNEYRTQPFIGNLKRLRKLEILTPSIEMTDASIKYGIAYCENLKVCIMRNAPITDIGLRKLVDSMYLEHLETTMCANIRGSGVKYALEKMNKREMTFVWNKYQSRLTTCCINKFLNGAEPVTCITPSP